MNLLTQKQRLFFIKRKIKEGGLYMFPKFGFTAYERKSLSSSIQIDTNPFTKSLYREQFEVKSIDGDWCKGNFYNKPNCPDFYFRKGDIERRDLIEIIFILIFTWIPFVIYNLLTKADTIRPKKIDFNQKLKSIKESQFTYEQLEKINNFYDKFTILINFNMTDTENSFKPCLKKLDEPLFWKAEHWKWFFESE